MLIFLDLETTGLDPQKDMPLEIAMAIVNERLEPVSGYHAVIRWAPDLIPMVPVVQQMHERNGLLAEVPGGKWCADAQYEILAWLPEGKHHMAGNSVHFDRAFLEVHMPRVHERFSHQLLDVTALHLARQIAGLEGCPVRADDNHRARGDVLASIEQAKWHLAKL